MSNCRSCKHSSPQMEVKPIVRHFLTCGNRKSYMNGEECKVKCEHHEKAK
jgi:hypothetical protein